MFVKTAQTILYPTEGQHEGIWGKCNGGLPHITVYHRHLHKFAALHYEAIFLYCIDGQKSPKLEI